MALTAAQKAALAPVAADNLSTYPDIFGARAAEAPPPNTTSPTLPTCVVDNHVEAFIEKLADVVKIDSNICRQRAAKYFNRFQMANNYLKLYQDVINGETW